MKTVYSVLGGFCPHRAPYTLSLRYAGCQYVAQFAIDEGRSARPEELVAAGE
jgi:hypothetical protein